MRSLSIPLTASFVPSRTSANGTRGQRIDLDSDPSAAEGAPAARNPSLDRRTVVA